MSARPGNRFPDPDPRPTRFPTKRYDYNASGGGQLEAIMPEKYPWSIEELAAAIAMFSHANVHSTKSGPALREAMQALLHPNELTQQAIDRLGLQPYTESGDLRPLSDLLQQIQAAHLEHADYWRIFGIRAGSTMRQLTKYSPDALRGLASKVLASHDRDQLLADTRRLVGQVHSHSHEM